MKVVVKCLKVKDHVTKNYEKQQTENYNDNYRNCYY